ncbi:multicomponent Na+:H+ antiporter subunit D [Methanocalculus alkaliphilus]|uniref:proton-conducting transporter transmembrane domain-containing protein n=1 Tax=Methanocalculus alkaliphilus TaxID=768730 RepID=UPI00209F06E5|nr:proton-conducting transporter membrane subunit [Methanocalculus alkaliphilus]MCP1714386.1 multicomponent Na+:H+ antiporter subunit D [Methanocalculus alkaliphilus]
MIEIPPALIYLGGLLLIPFLKGRAGSLWALTIGSLGLLAALLLPESSGGITLQILPGIETVILTVDPARHLAGVIFSLAGLMAIIYASYREPGGIQMAGILASIAAATGIVYAGDFITIFIFWELLALASLCIIWASDDIRSGGAGYRYLLFHIFGGACLLGGIVHTIITTGTAAIGPVGDGAGLILMLIGIGVNAAAIPVHTWLPDAYPAASIEGSVALCIFTTKAAVFLLAMIGGWGVTVAYIGAAMALYGAIFALLQDDIRRLLSYSVISQGGYMIAAIGAGTVAGLDAGIAHMAGDIIFKSLLFMAAGAVIYRTGRGRLSELGGMAKAMPLTALFAIIGGLGLAGVPGFSGGATKGMILEAATAVPFLTPLLLVTAVITAIYVFRFLYLIFFRAAPKESPSGDAPVPMLCAMGGAALLTVVIGVFPTILTDHLPGGTMAHPFALSHLGASLGILATAGLLILLIRPLRMPGQGWEGDIDRLYMAMGRGITWLSAEPLTHGAEGIGRGAGSLITVVQKASANPPVACRIAWKTSALPYVRAFSDPQAIQQYEESLKELRRNYQDEQTIIQGGGYGIILIAIVAFLYFLFDLIR